MNLNLFFKNGKQTCTIQNYKYKKYGKSFYSDLSTLVYSNSNITLPVIERIENLYQIMVLNFIKYDLT